MIYTGAVFFHIGATGENEPIIVNSIGRAWDIAAFRRALFEWRPRPLVAVRTRSSGKHRTRKSGAFLPFLSQLSEIRTRERTDPAAADPNDADISR